MVDVRTSRTTNAGCDGGVVSKTIRNLKLNVGGHSKIELLQVLSAKKIAFNSYATMIFMSNEFAVSERACQIILESVSVIDLGLLTGGTYREIVERAESQGLSFCSAEVAPYLRIQYKESVEHSGLLTIASLPFKNENMPNGFYLRAYDNHLWLRGYKATEDVVYDPQMEFVFSVLN